MVRHTPPSLRATSPNLGSLPLPASPDSPSGRGRAQVTHVQWLASSPSKIEGVP